MSLTKVDKDIMQLNKAANVNSPIRKLTNILKSLVNKVIDVQTKEEELQETVNSIIISGASIAENVVVSPIRDTSAINAQQALEDLYSLLSEHNILTINKIISDMTGTFSETDGVFSIIGDQEVNSSNIRAYLYRTLKKGVTYYIGLSSRAIGALYNSTTKRYSSWNSKVSLYKKDGTFLQSLSSNRRPSTSETVFNNYVWEFTPSEDVFIEYIAFGWSNWNPEATQREVYIKNFFVSTYDLGYEQTTQLSELEYKCSFIATPEDGGEVRDYVYLIDHKNLVIDKSTTFINCYFEKTVVVSDTCERVEFINCTFNNVSNYAVLRCNSDYLKIEGCKINGFVAQLNSFIVSISNNIITNSELTFCVKNSINDLENLFLTNADIIFINNRFTMGINNSNNREALHFIWIGYKGRACVENNTFIRPQLSGSIQPNSDIIDGYSSDNLIVRGNLFYTNLSDVEGESELAVNLKAIGYRTTRYAEVGDLDKLDNNDVCRYNAIISNNILISEGISNARLCNFQTYGGNTDPLYEMERANLVVSGNTCYSTNVASETSLVGCFGKSTNVNISNNAIYSAGPAFIATFEDWEPSKYLFMDGWYISGNICRSETSAYIFKRLRITSVKYDATKTFVLTTNNVLISPNSLFESYGVTATQEILDANNHYINRT